MQILLHTCSEVVPDSLKTASATGNELGVDRIKAICGLIALLPDFDGAGPGADFFSKFDFVEFESNSNFPTVGFQVLVDGFADLYKNK